MTKAKTAATCPTCHAALQPGATHCRAHAPAGHIPAGHPALSRTWDVCRCGQNIAWVRVKADGVTVPRLETAVQPAADGDLVATLVSAGVFGWPEYHAAPAPGSWTGQRFRAHHETCTEHAPRAFLVDRAVDRRKRHERDAEATAEVHTDTTPASPPAPPAPEYGCRACGCVFTSSTTPDIAGAVPCTACGLGLALRTHPPATTAAAPAEATPPPPAPAQPSLFDQPTPEQVTDAAIEAVDAAADPAWKRAASAAVFAIASTQPTFTADDIWQRVDKPREPSALGPVLRHAAALGIIRKTDTVQKSTRPEAHQKPLPVWRSLIHTPAPDIDGLDFAPLTTGDNSAHPQ